MAKSDPIESALNALSELRNEATTEIAVKEMRSYLGNRSNLVVAKAAKIAGELNLSQLIPDMVAAFGRLIKDAPRLDKRCAAITEIAIALYELDYTEPEVYRRGLHHIQKEASFGPPVDTAAALRGICAQGLLRTRDRDALADVVSLLVDPEPPARLGAVRALASNGGEAGVLLLRLKVLTGDTEPEVLGDCFSGLLAAAPEASLGFVAPYVDNGIETTAEAAIWALGGSRLPAAVDVLRKKWERTLDSNTRKVLIAALAASRLPESFEFLCSQLETASRQSAEDILTALAPYAGNDSLKQAAAAALKERGDATLLNAFRREFSL
jgi:HEAT repeat protein